MKTNNFRGELTNVLAKKEALVCSSQRIGQQTFYGFYTNSMLHIDI